METLDLFSILSYESKMSAFQFYYSLSRLTDNTGLNEPKVRDFDVCLELLVADSLFLRIDILLSSVSSTNGATS